MRKVLVVFAVSAALCSFSAQAGSPVYKLVGTEANEIIKTKAYVGLNWNMEGGATPALVLGVVRAKVNVNGDTKGANLSVHVSMFNGVEFSKIKLSYLNGKEDSQGELGLGYNFLQAAPLLGLGVSAPYVNLAADWTNGGGFDPNVTINSLEKWDRPIGGQKCVLDNNGGIGVSNCTP